MPAFLARHPLAVSSWQLLWDNNITAPRVSQKHVWECNRTTRRIIWRGERDFIPGRGGHLGFVRRVAFFADHYGRSCNRASSVVIRRMHHASQFVEGLFARLRDLAFRWHRAPGAHLQRPRSRKPLAARRTQYSVTTPNTKNFCASASVKLFQALDHALPCSDYRRRQASASPESLLLNLREVSRNFDVRAIRNHKEFAGNRLRHNLRARRPPKAVRREPV